MKQIWSTGRNLPPVGARDNHEGSSGAAEFVVADAASEGIPPTLARALFWLPLLSLAGLLIGAAIYRPAYDRMLQEDYPVEWGQFVCCLFICVVAFMSVRLAIRQRRWALAGLLVLLGSGCFFVAGEEISWAQRVLGIATPEDFHSNEQDEMNLHNFAGGFDPEAAFRQAQLLFSLVLAGLAVNGRVRDFRPDSFWRIVSPPLCAMPLLLTMLTYRFYRLFTPPEGNFAVRLQEWAEFCQYFGMVVAIACLYFALHQPAEKIVDIRQATGNYAVRDWRRLTTPVVVIGLITLVFAVMTFFSDVRAYN
ncbi:MAG TPA: hypothetical protein VLL08_06965 [Kineosporiaceae bacterium]|nr:hypothetical protein [Kineosporiaceae bacterium]